MMERPITIAVLAIGGQGGGVLVDWIVALAEREGWRAQSTSVPGVAQRTGATIYYVETIEARGRPRAGVLRHGRAGRRGYRYRGGVDGGRAGDPARIGDAGPDDVDRLHPPRLRRFRRKSAPGDGAADSGAVTAAARAAARQFVAFDMAAAAEQAGSVVSSVLFGAVCASGALPFERASFEAVITEAGIGVQGSLRGFALGFDGGAAPVARPSVEPMRPLGSPGDPTRCWHGPLLCRKPPMKCWRKGYVTSFRIRISHMGRCIWIWWHLCPLV